MFDVTKGEMVRWFALNLFESWDADCLAGVDGESD